MLKYALFRWVVLMQVYLFHVDSRMLRHAVLRGFVQDGRQRRRGFSGIS